MLIQASLGDLLLLFCLSPIPHPPALTTGQLTTTVSITTISHILVKVTHLRPAGREAVLGAEIQIS